MKYIAHQKSKVTHPPKIKMKTLKSRAAELAPNEIHCASEITSHPSEISNQKSQVAKLAPNEIHCAS
jgi:hypothetical protein